ncbi:unnamed protein product [Adineta steineri]|uniref:Uncharacterized protein n=1 Tax=Adineta steineri TaxID=433720 RepID=A0A815R4I2_9BILA|nr:unnamed protein product [Adineta steineri]
MSDFIPNKFQAIILQPDLVPEHNLNDLIVHCQDVEELKSIITKNPLSIKILACTPEFLLDISSLLPTLNLVELYLISNKTDVMLPIELIEMDNNFDFIQVHNQKQLMRYVCGKITQCFYAQSAIYADNDENSLHNSCLLVARDALVQMKEFV